MEDGYAVAAEKLCGLPERYKEREFLNISGWWPTGPREMQDHLRRLAPALREAGVLAEYWEKGGARRGAANAPAGFWLFLSTEKGRPTREQVEGLVWQRVAYMEGMEPVLGTFMDEV